MYVMIEYLVYVVLVVVLGACLFLASVVLVLTQEGVQRLVETSRKAVHRAAQFGANMPSGLATLRHSSTSAHALVTSEVSEPRLQHRAA